MAAKMKSDSAGTGKIVEVLEPDLQGALDDLEKLAQKPKKIPSEKVVSQGFKQIKTAIDQGYSFTDVARVFVKRGVRISTKELKEQYDSLDKAQHGKSSASNTASSK